MILNYKFSFKAIHFINFMLVFKSQFNENGNKIYLMKKNLQWSMIKVCLKGKVKMNNLCFW